jgi:hypothetical protein
MNYNCFMDRLIALQLNFDLEKSIKVFGELGEHLFEKFNKNERNILNFYTRLDAGNKEKLVEFITSIVS